MKTIFCLVGLLTLTSCQNEFENDPAMGAWKHVESLSDIGDGNATFHRVNSKKTLLFTAYGTVISNQNVCIGNNYSEETVATWNVDEKSFSAGDCIATYTVDEDIETLTVTYQCMEACGEKYVRAD